MPQESIIDASRPVSGRVYDYILGGYHNFEVDRQAAEQIRKLLPFIDKAVRLQRWCLQDIAIELTEKRGFNVIIDFASGLPTNDHIHHVVPRGTTVIYSDYDPVVVEYARDILKGTPDVYFFLADAVRPEELLNWSEVQNILGGRRDVALVYWGITGFLDDNAIRHAAHALYEWAGPGSCWTFQAHSGADPNDPRMIEVFKIYEQMGSPITMRSVEDFRRLVQPWHPDENGFISLLKWHGFDLTEISPEELPIVGATGAGAGAYLVK